MTGLLNDIAFISMPGGGEWMIILVIGLLIFGRRLPEVARSLGKSVNEFKKGMREFQESADEVARDVSKATSDVASEVKDASGMNDYGYEDPYSTSSYTGQYDSSEPVATTDESQDATPQPTGETGETSDAGESSDSASTEDTTTKTEGDPYVEPMK